MVQTVLRSVWLAGTVAAMLPEILSVVMTITARIALYFALPWTLTPAGQMAADFVAVATTERPAVCTARQ